MSCLTVTTSALFKSLLLGCVGGVVWLSIEGCSGSDDAPPEILDGVDIVGNNCSIPVVEDELLLLTRRWLTVVVDVDEERPLKPELLVYPLPIGTGGVEATMLVSIVVVVAEDVLLRLKSVGPVASINIKQILNFT
jgi:hypothetical protein